jgi:hypothetical protein
MVLVPAPVSKLDCVLPLMFLSLSVTTRVAVATPVALAGGENFTVMVQLVPAGTLVQLFVWVK